MIDDHFSKVMYFCLEYSASEDGETVRILQFIHFGNMMKIKLYEFPKAAISENK